MIHADTDGLLDRCHCGAVAGFLEDDKLTGKAMFRACCTDCCGERTHLFVLKNEAVWAWNLEMRRVKKGSKA